jgi:ribosomal protein S27E
MPLTRENLDHMASTVFDTGLPRPDPKAEPIVLQSRCHTNAPAVCWLDPTGLVLTLACSDCLRMIATVALAWPSRSVLHCRECGDDAVWASYRHASGRMRIECAGCWREIATLAVTSNAN